MRRLLSPLFAGLLVVLAFSPALAREATQWDRLNPNLSGSAPDHERLTCVARGVEWQCRYDKQPEPRLNLSWDRTRAVFVGIGGAECPEELGTLCDEAVEVVDGTAEFVEDDGQRLTFHHQLILTTADGVAPMYVYWVDMFVCPWYTTFEDALAANPFPLPFNGEDWPASDCVFF